MIRSQETGRRYLAGFVMASAIVYLGLTCVASGMAWRDTYPPWLLANFIAVGLAPSLAAFALGMRAWTRPESAAGLSATALIILLCALALWQLFVVSF